jgi:hypothetical protein
MTGLPEITAATRTASRCPCHDPVVLGHLRLTCPRTAVAAMPDLQAEPEGIICWANMPVQPLPAERH